MKAASKKSAFKWIISYHFAYFAYNKPPQNISFFILSLLPSMRRLFFILNFSFFIFLLTACGTSQNAATADLGSPAEERGINNESQATKYSSYSKISDLDAANYTDIYAYIRAKIGGTNRGVTSVNSGTDALWVVDGIQVSSIDGMSPMDIYSVEYIKDASTAIYGFRGVNGVFNIVTKAGHAQKEAESEARKAAQAAKKAARAAKKGK